MNFILASHNQHKAKEILAILDDNNLTISTLNDIGYNDEIIEDGNTLEENAWIKANTIHTFLASNVMADDTGLEVDTLEGKPGVYSARYAGADCNSEDNIDKLLLALEKHTNRGAQFRTVVAVWINSEKFEFEGVIRGHILKERQGKGGFGYDAVFVPEGFNDSFGVLSPRIKNEISHRAKAFRKLAIFLKSRS